MKKISILISLVVFSFIGISFFSCDKIEKGEYLTEVASPGEKDIPEVITDFSQRFLIEDFTGQKCPNCPEAARTANGLMEKYSNVYFIGIHNSGQFSSPTPTYNNNFETDEGQELKVKYAPSTYPKGMVNRISKNGSPLMDHGVWEQVIDENKSNVPDVYMTLKGSSFNDSTKKVNVKVSTMFPTGGLDNLNLVLAVTEDGIIGIQVDGKNDVLDYEHNHVLRQMPLGAWGSPYIVDTVTTGGSIAFRYEFDLREGLVSENCSLIGYLIKMDTDNKEIIQADAIQLKDILK